MNPEEGKEAGSVAEAAMGVAGVAIAEAAIVEAATRKCIVSSDEPIGSDGTFSRKCTHSTQIKFGQPCFSFHCAHPLPQEQFQTGTSLNICEANYA